MDSIKSSSSICVPVRTQVGSASPGEPSPPPAAPDSYEPGSAPVNLFLTRQQALALVQSDSSQAPPELPKASQDKRNVNDKLKEALPEPIKAVIDGVAIPGTLARIKPRFDNGMAHGPSGLDFKMKW